MYNIRKSILLFTLTILTLTVSAYANAVPIGRMYTEIDPYTGDVNFMIENKTGTPGYLSTPLTLQRSAMLFGYTGSTAQIPFNGVTYDGYGVTVEVPFFFPGDTMGASLGQTPAEHLASPFVARFAFVNDLTVFTVMEFPGPAIGESVTIELASSSVVSTNAPITIIITGLVMLGVISTRKKANEDPA